MAESTREHILVVESNNATFPNNTMNKFRVRLPREIPLPGEWELALMDLSVPYQSFNIPELNYIFIGRYTKKKFIGKYRVNVSTINPDDVKEPSLDGSYAYSPDMRSINSDDEKEYAPSPESDRILHDEECILLYGIKLKIPPGYYESVDDLMLTIQSLVEITLQTNELKLDNRAALALLPRSQENFMKALHNNDILKSTSLFRHESFYMGEDYDEHTDRLYNPQGFSRIGFHKESRRTYIKPDLGEDPNNFYTVLNMSEEVSSFLGYDAQEVVFANNAWRIDYSPYICRISPEDTLYLYCSSINNIFISGTEGQLLRAVSFGYPDIKFGATCFTEFNNLHFVRLNTDSLLFLAFELRGTSSDLIDFQSGSKSVRLTLKIRRCKQLDR